MDELSVRCPRCKQGFTGSDAEQLATTVIAHAQLEHGHAPPREHVVSRIERHASGATD